MEKPQNSGGWIRIIEETWRDGKAKNKLWADKNKIDEKVSRACT